MTSVRDPQPVACGFCDFSSGQRGMDRCGKCDGTGSVFRVGLRIYPNTDQGFEKARAALNPHVQDQNDREHYSSWLIFDRRVRMSMAQFEAMPVADRSRCDNPYLVDARVMLPNASGALRWHLMSAARINVYTTETRCVPSAKYVAREIVVRVPAVIIPAVRYAA